MSERCGFCKSELASSVDIGRCGRCKKIYYCNTVCQTRDWDESHSTICKEEIEAPFLRNFRGLTNWEGVLKKFYEALFDYTDRKVVVVHLSKSTQTEDMPKWIDALKNLVSSANSVRSSVKRFGSMFDVEKTPGIAEQVESAFRTYSWEVIRYIDAVLEQRDNFESKPKYTQETFDEVSGVLTSNTNVPNNIIDDYWTAYSQSEGSVSLADGVQQYALSRILNQKIDPVWKKNVISRAIGLGKAMDDRFKEDKAKMKKDEKEKTGKKRFFFRETYQ